MKPSYEELEQRLIESERYGRQTDITIDNLEMKLAQMAAENAGLKSEVPMGAIENGRAFADRLEAYQFECQGGNLNMCSDWQELRHCFEHLSEWALHGQPETPATDDFLSELRASAIEELMEKSLWDTVNCLNGIGAFDKVNDRREVQGIIRDELKERVTEFAAQIRKGVRS